MMKSSNLDGLSSFHIPSSSIFHSKCTIFHPPTSNPLYPSSILHLQHFFLHPGSKERDIWLKNSSKQAGAELCQAQQSFSQVPSSWGYLFSQLWLEMEAWVSCSLESTGTGGGGGGWMKCKTSWGWAVPSSAELRLATTSLELCTSRGCLLSQLWLDLEAWVNCCLETTGTVLGLDEIAE